MTLMTRSSLACGLATALALTPAAAIAQQAQQSGRSKRSSSTPASLGIHGFSVVLVVGSMQGTSAASSDLVPESARKALADMKDFLPYKRYQLLDAGWMLCCASSNDGVSGRIRGPGERDYTYIVDPIGVSNSKLNLRFSLRESRDLTFTGGSIAVKQSASRMSDPTRLEHALQLNAAIKETNEAEAQLRSAKQLHQKGLISTPDVETATIRHSAAVQRVEELQRVAGRKVVGAGHLQNIIDSTFSIALGETVVIGTSRLNGDQALIAILTAAAKPGVTRPPQ